MSKKEAVAVKNPAKVTVSLPGYREAGFIAIANHLDCRFRDAIAVEHYRKISKDVWDDLVQYGHEVPGGQIRVHLTPVKEYLSEPFPNSEVLVKLIEAKGKRCFDGFCVMSLDNDPDPVLLGRVRLKPDYNNIGNAYVIARWGGDISLDWLYKVAK